MKHPKARGTPAFITWPTALQLAPELCHPGAGPLACRPDGLKYSKISAVGVVEMLPMWGAQLGDMRRETRDAQRDGASPMSKRLISRLVSRPRAIAQLASGGHARGTANGAPISSIWPRQARPLPLRLAGTLALPRGGRGTTALPRWRGKYARYWVYARYDENVTYRALVLWRSSRWEFSHA